MKDGPYFEDLPVGTLLETGTYAMTREEIEKFAAVYDPQPFHLSDAGAASSVFRRQVASGWHTAAVTMKLLVESGFFGSTGLVGLGVDELRWPKAVLPGDVIKVRTKVVENTPTSSGKRAQVRWGTTVLNQDDEVVFSFTSLSLFPGRPR
ncbi:MAG: MaoC family dehydratase [Candidatus Eremiobacteraeota bacterium]|nr:MaoC family dehydratase [Candidatus Eremiobacteraeota bacterium]